MLRPKISVIIANKDDNYLLKETLKRLNKGMRQSEFEIIIVDDGSFDAPPTELRYGMRNVRIFRLDDNYGVGYAFDYGAQRAVSDVLLLMGSDVLVKERSWLTDALRGVYEHPKSIICSTCVALNDINDDWRGKKRYYGADISMEQTRRNKQDILQAKWITKKKKKGLHEIPCVLGACYAVNRDWYMHLGGWGHIKSSEGLRQEEEKWIGHRYWGGLEPLISLKSWLAGGVCHVDTTWSTGHVFNRDSHVRKNRPSRWDMYWFNKLFIAYTLLPKDIRQNLEKKLSPYRNENLAKKYIKKNIKAINREKAYNQTRRKVGLSIFEKKFGYDFSRWRD